MGSGIVGCVFLNVWNVNMLSHKMLPNCLIWKITSIVKNNTDKKCFGFYANDSWLMQIILCFFQGVNFF